MSGPRTAGGQSAQPLIVLAELAKPDFRRLDALRRAHYPAHRNRVPAHLTLFRALPPSAEEEVRRSLARAAEAPPPPAGIAGPMALDSGVALRVSSPALEAIREALAREFHGLLTSQDSGPWVPHVTIQNKAEQREAKALLKEMRETFERTSLAIRGLSLVRYVEGEWEPISGFRFASR